jgi:hypothetical protein
MFLNRKELNDRLKLLIGSKNAGNTSKVVSNEIKQIRKFLSK